MIGAIAAAVGVGLLVAFVARSLSVGLLAFGCMCLVVIAAVAK